MFRIADKFQLTESLWNRYRTTNATTTLQDLSYSYDSVGNITRISDYSYTNAHANTFFTYDNLNRLTSASTTNATTTDWPETRNGVRHCLLTKSGVSYTFDPCPEQNASTSAEKSITSSIVPMIVTRSSGQD